MRHPINASVAQGSVLDKKSKGLVWCSAVAAFGLLGAGCVVCAITTPDKVIARHAPIKNLINFGTMVSKVEYPRPSVYGLAVSKG